MVLCKFYAQYYLTQQLNSTGSLDLIFLFHLANFTYMFSHLFWLQNSEVCLVGPSSPVWMWSSWRSWCWRMITTNRNTSSQPFRRGHLPLRIRACLDSAVVVYWQVRFLLWGEALSMLHWKAGVRVAKRGQRQASPCACPLGPLNKSSTNIASVPSAGI